MAKEKDPEELLAQALRAQAAHAPPPYEDRPVAPGVSPGFGLLSGSDHGLAERIETLAEEPVPYVVGERQRFGVGLVLLLALVLGLAAGAVVGLITVL
ncbi:hypothetical protein [Actinocrispum wychmicini]|uniref:hypothetical protein n=1 Tax=Actinocrispum wychmicini TaxID=1213861 RepID=UPI00104AF1EF|nr:hypothetical protein [Actinocrispum wychmicini]